MYRLVLPISVISLLLTVCKATNNNPNLLSDIVDSENVQVVYPKVYEATVRRKRDISSSIFAEESVEHKIVEIGNWALELNSEGNLIAASGLQGEWISANGDKTLKGIRRCDYRAGVVRGLETSSVTAVTLCGPQITGFLDFVGGLTYFFQPLNASNGAHILYTRNPIKQRMKRSVSNIDTRAESLSMQSQWLFNLTGDTIDIGHHQSDPRSDPSIVRDNGEIPDVDLYGRNSTTMPRKPAGPHRPYKEWHREQLEDDEIGYFYDVAWTAVTQQTYKRTGTPLPTRWLEIALAVDHTVISFHGKEKVEQYVLSLMNIVSAIYQDPSLEANLKLIITRMMFYEHKKQSIVRLGNARKSLENANSWNNRLHMSLAPGETKHDVAVWLTRSDIGGPSGYAPVAGACDPQRSCALNRDEGLSSAFIIAHEMAHILGLSHDGDRKANNDCDNDAMDGSVMAPLVASTFNKFSWSSCSRDEFRKKVQKWSCLSNTPTSPGQIKLNASLQTFFTMDEQCRMEFGDGYVLCRAFDIVEPCSHLWCGHEKSPLVCKTKKGPPLEGTECGFDKWCVNGYCEDIGQHRLGGVPVVLNPQDGAWSDWSPWGSCSLTCGTGVRFRTRRCDNPPPTYGGADCLGSSEEWEICNNKPCPDPLQDLRAQQCKRLPKILALEGTREGNLTWLPYESEQGKMKCKLTCISEGTKELFLTNENLVDGTPCSYDNHHDICVQGHCKSVGCDGKLNSKLDFDSCGVCGGNNSQCTRIKSHHQRKLRREVSRVAVFPRLARNVSVEVNVTFYSADQPSVALLLKNRKKKRYTVTIPNVGAYAEILEGAKFYYKKYGNRHNLWSKGPVLAEMVVLVYASPSEIHAGLNISTLSKYIIHKDSLILSKRYHWIKGGWGPCSASCGGGKRQETVACWDKQNNKLVRRKFCSLLAKPVQKIESCNNFGCNFRWITGNWEPCSATCGLKGMQFRELYCVPQTVLNKMLFENNGTMLKDTWNHMVNPKKCSDVTPADKRPCNRVPCPSYWQYEDWSECSASCGHGLTTRNSHCVPPANESFYTCGETPPLQKKVCYGQYNRYTNHLCRGNKLHNCKEDKSKYCDTPLFSRYCKIRGFRRICCKSCALYAPHLTPISI